MDKAMMAGDLSLLSLFDEELGKILSRLDKMDGRTAPH